MCKLDLVVDASETDDESIVGDVCHMVAEEADGPRGDSPLSLAERNKYSNLLLLCKVHHKEVDDQVNKYSLDMLSVIKSEHESWVRAALDFDRKLQEDDEIYAGYVEEWDRRLKLDSWTAWTSPIFSSGQPSISDEMWTSLTDVRRWLLSRVWPGRYVGLESSLRNFQHIAQDFCFVFAKHAERWNEDVWMTKKFYNSDRWNPSYLEDGQLYDAHVDLVEDLGLELTRAANYVCDKVRDHISRHYRRGQGVLLIESGPNLDLTFVTHRVEYRGKERIEFPYPGLATFDSVRFDRDLFFGGDERPSGSKS